MTSRLPAPRPFAARSLLAAAVLAALCSGVAVAATVPSAVLPGEVAGTAVTIEPAALRLDDGRGEVDVVLGSDATEPVVVDVALRQPDVAADGTVGPADEAAPGRTTAGARLEPGERLRVTVDAVTEVALLVAEVRATDGTEAGTLASLLLPGAAPSDPPALTLGDADGVVVATVTTTAPTLVTLQVGGAEPVTLPDRLLVPGQPLALDVEPARWPLPTEVVVVDDQGRAVRASTGTTLLAALAGGLLLATAAAVAWALHRRRSAKAPTVSF